jgi:tight adherence protein C
MDAGPSLRLFGDSGTMTLSLLVFLSAGTLAFALMLGARARSAVRRRAAGVATGEHSDQQNSLRHSGVAVARKLVDYTTKHYVAVDGENVKVLRRRLLQAGIYGSQAAAYFFLARAGMALALALAAAFALSLFDAGAKTSFWLMIMVAAVLGYLAPSFYLDRRAARRRLEHQAGFPDFLDLLVVCADAGLAMEAALERVARELGDTHRSLAANIHITNLEIRAGSTLTEALEHLADRLGLDEARSFANLIQQSDELGSSISHALRVYSDDMRHKRLSRAEEKAYSLPTKLTVPMMICIFPAIFIVILTPVIVRVATGSW